MDEKVSTQTNLKLRGKNTQKSPVRLLILKLKEWIPFRPYFCLDSISAFSLSLLTESKEVLWKLTSPHLSPHISTQRVQPFPLPLVSCYYSAKSIKLVTSSLLLPQSPNILPCLYFSSVSFSSFISFINYLPPFPKTKIQNTLISGHLLFSGYNFSLGDLICFCNFSDHHFDTNRKCDIIMLEDQMRREVKQGWKSLVL